jgi:hypothetical protein
MGAGSARSQPLEKSALIRVRSRVRFPNLGKQMELQIQIDPHTLKRAEERGATESEIKEILRTGEDIPAKKNRKARSKVYSFNRERNGKFYEQKRVEVYYVEDAGKIITVTVSLKYH